MEKNSAIRPSFNSSLLRMDEDKQFINDIVKLNAKANNYGLAITEDIASEIAAYRKQALIENARFEMKSDAIYRLTSAFLESRYIDQKDFAHTIGELIDIFYFIKNETANEIPDDEVISEMLQIFTETCFGSMELMESKGLEKILRRYKHGDTDIWSDYENTNWEDYYNDGDESWRE